jgi:translation initiation factor IF-3
MRRAKRKTSVPPRPRVTARVNEQIAAEKVRVVDEAGAQVGVMRLADAREYAETRSLDLIEVAGDADPPVCRLGDYGRWRYEEERRLRAGRKNQVQSTPKEVRLRPRIGTHDYAWKRDQAIGFLRARSKVKLIMTFRGREREHPELGRQLFARLADDVAAFGHPEGQETFEGRSMTMVLSPNGAAR